jgi:PRC-barrel domain
MLKSHMAACLVATALAAAPAFAQTSTSPSGGTDRPAATGSGSTTSGSSAMQPSAGATVGTNPASSGGSPTQSGSSTVGQSETPSPPGTASTASGSSSSGTSGASTAGTGSSATMSSAGGPASGQIVSQQQPGQWMASKLIGTTVVGPNNESIGDVNDVLLDRSGQAVAVIIGVGGFLGIGEKDVAVSFSQLEFTSRNGSVPRTTGSTGGSGTTGTTGTGTGAAGSTAASGAPERIMIRMTKQDLQNAPRFARADQQGDTTATGATGSGPRPASGDRGTTGASPGGGSQAPRQ